MMKRMLFICVFLSINSLKAMEAAAASAVVGGLETLAVEKISSAALAELKTLITKSESAILHPSSIFSLSSHVHPHDVLKTIKKLKQASQPIRPSDVKTEIELPTLKKNTNAPKRGGIDLVSGIQDVESGMGGLPPLENNNPQQAEVGAILQLAQQAENYTKASSGTGAILCRVVYGLLFAAFGAADLATNYGYINPSHSHQSSGQQATNGVFSAGTDLGIIGTGLYQIYLAATSWDNKQLQKDAAVNNALVQQHLGSGI